MEVRENNGFLKIANKTIIWFSKCLYICYKKDSTMPVYIPTGADLISQEMLEESAEQEIEILFGKLKKGEMQSRWDIIRLVKEKFIPVVEKLLIQLEKEKSSAESLIYEKLQETQILI